MNWSTACYSMVGQFVKQAMFISAAWEAAAQSGDVALLSNLACNMLQPYGVCAALDSAGVPLSRNALALIDQ